MPTTSTLRRRRTYAITPTPTPSSGVYFAPDFFAPTYFAPTYWPGITSTPKPTLYDALRARLLSGEPRLTDCYRRQPPDKAFAYPYAIYNDLNESPDWVSGVNVYPSWVNVQVTIVSTDDVLAEDVRDSCYLLFTPRRTSGGAAANPPLIFGDGGMTSGGFTPGLKTQYRSPGRSADGKPLWLFSFALRLLVTRGM